MTAIDVQLSEEMAPKVIWKVGPAVPRTTPEGGVAHTSETSGGQPNSTIVDSGNRHWISRRYSCGKLVDEKLTRGEKLSNAFAAVASEAPVSDGVVFSQEPGNSSVAQALGMKKASLLLRPQTY